MQGKKISFTIHNFKFKYVRQMIVMIVFHLQWDCHSSKMTSLSILLAAVFLGTGRFFPKLFMGACSSSSCLNVCEV